MTSFPAESRPLLRTADLLKFSLAAGLLTGVGETCLLLIKRFLRGRFITVGEHALWLAPVADAILFLLLGAILLSLTRRLSPERRTQVVVAMVSFLGLATMLTLWGRFHWGATLLLSLGLALRFNGFLIRRLVSIHSRLYRAVRALLAVVLLTAVGVFGERWWLERKTLQPVPAHPMPNVLLIILDTVRSFSLGLYGHGRANTPELERWARQGTVFERAMAPSSWTLPSHAGMFTGRWQTELSVRFNRPLDGTWPTLAERLAASGYATGGFVANLIYTPRESGLARGFSHYDDFGLNLRVFVRSATLIRKLVDRPWIRWLTREWHPALWKSADHVSSAALAWIGRNQERPWFAFLNYMEAHDPWYVPAPFNTMYGPGGMEISWKEISTKPMPPADARARFVEGYDAAIAYLDQVIGSLLDSLHASGELENTIVVITSDHGEEIGEHNALGHGFSLYRTAVQIPLLMFSPACRDANLRQPAPVTLRDFPATIMEMAGIADHPFPGRSFAGLVCRSPDAAAQQNVFAVLREANRPGEPTLISVIKDSLRYISDGQGAGELYNFERDPLELHNLTVGSEGTGDLRALRRLADSLRNPTTWGH